MCFIQKERIYWWKEFTVTFITCVVIVVVIVYHWCILGYWDTTLPNTDSKSPCAFCEELLLLYNIYHGIAHYYMSTWSRVEESSFLCADTSFSPELCCRRRTSAILLAFFGKADTLLFSSSFCVVLQGSNFQAIQSRPRIGPIIVDANTYVKTQKMQQLH